ncbi:40S ribosomal protein S29 [Pestalotiopsis sp. IQ-011]
MKFLSAITLAIASLATANPIEPRGLQNFDSDTGARLNLVNASFGPNRGLYYKGIGLAQIYDKGQNLQAVKAQSNPNVLTYGELDRLSDPYPYITSVYTGSSGTFNLSSIYLGCVLGNIPGACTINIVAYKKGVKVGSVAAAYQPISTIPAAMTQITFPASFQGIDSVRFNTVFLDRILHPSLGGATFLDDIRYTYDASTPST